MVGDEGLPQCEDREYQGTVCLQEGIGNRAGFPLLINFSGLDRVSWNHEWSGVCFGSRPSLSLERR